MLGFLGRRHAAIAAAITLLLLVLAGTAADGRTVASHTSTAKHASARKLSRRAAARARRHKRRSHRHHKAKPHKVRKPKSTVPGSAVSGEAPVSGGKTAAISSDPLAGIPFYVGESAAASTAHEWASQGRTSEAALLGKIAAQPQAQWFGDWSDGHGGTAGDVGWWVGAASATGTLPVIVAYDLPWRDCSQYSGGGAASPAAYREFIDAMAAGIAGRRTAVILEPDALAELSCLNAEQQASWYSLLSYAVTRLGESPAVTVYLDAGNAGWQPAATIAARLRQANVAGARGFSLNVSNFDATASETAYGEAIVHELGGTGHFVIDTSRNGNGAAPGGEWCNPPGRALGTPPTATTEEAAVDGYLWVKRPGESDGQCNGGPAAGQFWPSYALGLAQSASW
ncbi:MAG TPA: glycoside hydrolase family 6 protein [Solirubrobacteraceae bacterium]|nr:glycoside hydrolase family 6 protein [Solirubrobacteraceae bacterium]